MPKAYWIATYRSVSDPAALARYAEVGPAAIAAGGGRVLARGLPAKAWEGAPEQRCVVIEFDSVEKAIATYESPAYQAARALLEGAVEREVRIVEGTPDSVSERARRLRP
jgi:uncharacterized protein (DUF1330 family)